MCKPTRHATLTIALLLLAAIVLSREAAATERLVWPPAPDQPRIEYVRAFSKPAELGIGKGFFARVKDLLFGEADERLVRPMAVAVSRGVIYVADPGAKGIHRFDVVHGAYDLLKAAGDIPLPSPVGLARGAEGEIYATDSALGKVFVIRPGDASAAPLPLAAKLSQPTGIAYDAARGQLIVTDTAEHRIKRFNLEGKLVATLGQRGGGNGEFNFPTHLWLTPQGRLLVTDSLNFRIQSFDTNGLYLGKFGQQGDGTGDSARPKGIAADRHGHIYVADALFHALQIFDGNGRLLLPVGGHGNERGEFWLPAGLFIDTDDSDLIYVADSQNRRIQVLRYIGGAT